MLSAAQAAGVRRYIVQSRGFYLDAPEGQLADETAKLRYSAPGEIGKAARAVGEYDEQILATPSLDGVVLRYGFFYGPGTWYRPNGAIAEQVRKRELAIIGEGNAVWSFVHIDDAVAATVASLTAEQGVYRNRRGRRSTARFPMATGFRQMGRCARAASREHGERVEGHRRGSCLLSYPIDRSLEQSGEGATRVCAPTTAVEASSLRGGGYPSAPAPQS